MDEKNMNNNARKKGLIVAQFVVLLVIAVIMIFVVTSFGSRIWSSVFSDDDKSTLKSFETLYTTINMISQSPSVYESTSFGVYLANKYEIIYFNEPVLKCQEVKYVSTGGMVPSTNSYISTKEYYMPKDCEPNKQCLCLYDKDPEDGESNRDKNVVRCHSMEKAMEIYPEYFILNSGVCYPDLQKWNDLIIAKNNTTPNVPDDRDQLFVIIDNEANRELDAKWSLKICPGEKNGGFAVAGICYGERDGTILSPSIDTEFDEMYQHCLGQNYKSTSVKCIYRDTQNCEINCAEGDVTSKCGTDGYKTCKDFNKDTGVTYYISPDNYESYRLCKNDPNFCNFKCKLDEWKPYICKKSPDGSIYGACDSIPDACKEYYFLEYELRFFVKSYDNTDTNTECSDYMTENFYPEPVNILACKPDKITECEQFITQRRTECELKVLTRPGGSYSWITYNSPGCEGDVRELFEIAQFCNDDILPTP